MPERPVFNPDAKPEAEPTEAKSIAAAVQELEQAWERLKALVKPHRKDRSLTNEDREALGRLGHIAADIDYGKW